MGRQAIELDEKELAQFEALSAFLTLEGIGDYLGISRRTLQEIRKRQPEIDAIYKKGKALKNANVAKSLVKSALEGNTTAQIFYLKTQAGWREQAPEQKELPPLTINVIDATPE